MFNFSVIECIMGASVALAVFGFIMGMLYEAHKFPHGSITTINQVETTCIQCRRERKFTRRGIYR